jgi:hypothetical protein
MSIQLGGPEVNVPQNSDVWSFSAISAATTAASSSAVTILDNLYEEKVRSAKL